MPYAFAGMCRIFSQVSRLCRQREQHCALRKRVSLTEPPSVGYKVRQRLPKSPFVPAQYGCSAHFCHLAARSADPQIVAGFRCRPVAVRLSCFVFYTVDLRALHHPSYGHCLVRLVVDQSNDCSFLLPTVNHQSHMYDPAIRYHTA